jgi:hypothetical protein
MSAALALLLPLLTGCGSKGHSNPMAPVPPSSQSGALLVVATVAADADSAGNVATQFTVSLADTGSGAAATGATVSFSTPSGSVSLTEDPSTPGTYRAQQSGHAAGTYTCRSLVASTSPRERSTCRTRTSSPRRRAVTR